MARRAGRGGGGRKPSRREVEDLERYEALKALMEQVGFEVTVARSLDGRGGSCLVRGEHRVILAHRLPVPERIELLLEALRGVDLDDVHVRPDLRELIEAEARSAGRIAGGQPG